MTTEAPKPTHYELPTGAVAILEEILPTPQWYKDEQKQAALIVRAMDAVDALPETAARPKPEKDETKGDFDARADAWAATNLEFNWTDKMKEAAKACVKYYIKQGALSINANSVALITLFGLADE